MNGVTVYVEGVGLFGPGLSGWVQARSVLTGVEPWVDAAVVLPAPEALPPAERRRVGLALKLAMAVGFDAVRNAACDPAALATVFSSTGSDCDNCHQILQTLASEDRAVSPTRFHNSVHNMPAGYWSIATGCMAPSTSLCAYDATFAAGLLEAATQAVCHERSTLLVACDSSYPEPLNALRPISHAMGVGLVLTPQRTPRSLASLSLGLTSDQPDVMREPSLESLRTGVPAARSLPLLSVLAMGHAARLVLENLSGASLAVEVAL